MRLINLNFSRRLLVATFFCAALVRPGFTAFEDEDEREAKNWQESSVEMPVAPQSGSLLPFHVSAATDNQFFIDGASLVVGPDGVVRYVLVIQAAGGARNVSFEGIRCEARERRVYALGRLDGTWSPSRNEAWQRIRDVPANRHYTALFYDYFCPGGTIVGSAAEARDALRRGGHPANRRW